MKIASDKLFKVIQSMTKAEKRYFKLWILRYNIKQSRRSIELFDVLNKQTTYNEKALLKMLKTATLKKNLSVHKKLLLNDLLQSLRSQHIHNHQQIKIQEQLDYVVLLRDRNLIAIALELVDKIILSTEINDFLVLNLKALQLKENLLHIESGMNKNTKQCIENILDQQKEVLKQLVTQNKVQKLRHQIHHSLHNNYTTNNSNKKQSIDLIGNELRKILPKETTRCCIYLQLTLVDYLYSTKKFILLKQAFNKMNNYFENHPNQIQFNPACYYAFLQKKGTYLYQIKNYNALKELRTDLIKFSQCKELPIYLKQMAKISQIQITKELILAGQEAPKNKEQEWFNWYNESDLNPMQTLMSLRVLMSYYFIKGNYQKVLDLYLGVDRSIIENGSLHNSLICKYIIMGTQFELGNINTLSYWVRNIRYTLKKENVYTGHKKIMLNFFQKGPAPLQEDYNKLVIAFSKQQVAPEDYIGVLFQLWLTSKVKRRKIAELYRGSAIAS